MTHTEPNPSCTPDANHPQCMDDKGDLVRVDTGGVVQADCYGRGNAPPGSMYWWNIREERPSGPEDWDHPNLRRPTPDAKRGPSHTFADGPHLIVVLPNGHPWNIDSRASNCTMPYEYGHRCWVRHGEPPAISVDKAGVTCSAGGGSIESGNGGPPEKYYHGFLTAGVLTP